MIHKTCWVDCTLCTPDWTVQLNAFTLHVVLAQIMQRLDWSVLYSECCDLQLTCLGNPGRHEPPTCRHEPPIFVRQTDPPPCSKSLCYAVKKASAIQSSFLIILGFNPIKAGGSDSTYRLGGASPCICIKCFIFHNSFMSDK